MNLPNVPDDMSCGVYVRNFDISENAVNPIIGSMNNRFGELDQNKDNIIEDTDKSKLKNKIEKAQQLYDKSKEGSKETQGNC